MITRGLVRDWLVTTVIQNATAALLRVSGLAMPAAAAVDCSGNRPRFRGNELKCV